MRLRRRCWHGQSRALDVSHRLEAPLEGTAHAPKQPVGHVELPPLQRDGQRREGLQAQHVVQHRARARVVAPVVKFGDLRVVEALVALAEANGARGIERPDGLAEVAERLGVLQVQLGRGVVGEDPGEDRVLGDCSGAGQGKEGAGEGRTGGVRICTGGALVPLLQSAPQLKAASRSSTEPLFARPCAYACTSGRARTVVVAPPCERVQLHDVVEVAQLPPLPALQQLLPDSLDQQLPPAEEALRGGAVAVGVDGNQVGRLRADDGAAGTEAGGRRVKRQAFSLVSQKKEALRGTSWAHGLGIGSPVRLPPEER